MSDEFFRSLIGTSFRMGDRFFDYPLNHSSDHFFDRSSGRESVKLLLIGKPEAVQQTINDLYTCRFCEPGVWSKPLTFPETREAIDRTPGEVLRIYKRYLTR